MQRNLAMYYLAAVIALTLGLYLLPTESFILSKAYRTKQYSKGLDLAVIKCVETKNTDHGLDARTIKDGSLIEYVTSKGSKVLAIVTKRKGLSLEVMNSNPNSLTFLLQFSKVTNHIQGYYALSDLEHLVGMISELNASQVESLWESTSEKVDSPVVDVSFVSEQVFGSTDALCMFATTKLMALYGNVYFEERASPTIATTVATAEVNYIPLAAEVVQLNLKNRAALQEFKLQFYKAMTSQSSSSSNSPPLMLDMPERVLSMLEKYSKGLKEIAVKVAN
jgi:hypothetical protein